jgi:folate-binding protein YgfZ
MPNAFPLHELHAAAGARFGAPCGAELPLDYGDAAAEYDAVRTRVGLLDHGDAGVLEVTGRDRASFLHAMLSNDVTSLAPGQGCAAAFLDIHGKVQVTLRLLVLDDRVLVITPSGRAATTSAALDHYLFSEKAVFRDATAEMFMLTLAGPEALALAKRLTGTAAPERSWSHEAAHLGTIALRLVRGDGQTGEDEVWLVGPAADGPVVWRAALAGGARPIGLTAKNALRIEAGTPCDGHDVDETVLLPEIPIEHLVSYTKGCYIGQEVVVRIRDRGHVNRHLRGLLLEGERVPAAGATVLAAGQEIGQVTSAAWSFGRGRPVALGFVRRQHAEPGTPVAVRIDGSVVPATVSALPFTR